MRQSRCRPRLCGGRKSKKVNESDRHNVKEQRTNEIIISPVPVVEDVLLLLLVVALVTDVVTAAVEANGRKREMSTASAPGVGKIKLNVKCTHPR